MLAEGSFPVDTNQYRLKDEASASLIKLTPFSCVALTVPIIGPELQLGSPTWKRLAHTVPPNGGSLRCGRRRC